MGLEIELFLYICHSRSSELELAGEGEKETVVQKYRRLKCEVKELLDEIEEAKSSGDGPEAAASVVALAKEGDRLRKQLDELRLEEIFGEHASELTDPQEAQLKYVLNYCFISCTREFFLSVPYVYIAQRLIKLN